MRSGKDLHYQRKKARFKKQAREQRQRQKARRAGYLTDLGRFQQLEAENLPRVYEMRPPCQE